MAAGGNVGHRRPAYIPGYKIRYGAYAAAAYGFGAILVNLPLSGAVTQGGEEGIIDILFNACISNELFPLLLFIGIGAR